MDNLLRYTSRDYNSIKADLLTMINSVNSEWTNREESDPGIMLLSLMAALGDNLSFNMDMQAMEMYLSTVTQRKNCKKILQLGGYKMHWYRSAVTEITVVNNTLNTRMIINTDLTDTANNNQVILSADGMTYYTIFVPDNINYDNQNITSVSINPQSAAKFIGVEGRLRSVSIPVSGVINNRYYLPETNIDEAHLYLYDPDANKYWKLVDDLNLTTEMGRYFEFNVDEFDNPYIQLVSYWENYFNKDNNSSDLELYYLSSNGADGSVGTNAFSYFVNTPLISSTGIIEEDLDYTITNTSNQYGTLVAGNSPGYNPQTVQDAKADYANYITTYNTLVTLFDFERFVTRQSGFHVARSIDGQKAMDLNEIIFDSYSDGDNTDYEALLLGYNPEKYPTELEEIIQPVPTAPADLANLHRYRKYVFGGSYSYETTTKENFDKDTIGYSYTKSKSIKNYTLNIYTVYLSYDQQYNQAQYGLNSEEGANSDYWLYPKKLKWDPEPDGGFEEIEEIRALGADFSDPTDPNKNFFNRFNVTFTRSAPFRRYQITDEVADSLQKKMIHTKIITVDVEFPEIRVFDWRVKGTLYLYETIGELEANSLISVVIDALQAKFTPEYVGFGNKINYMDVIEVINNCDSRIKYFDAGYGVEPLIDYAECFDVANYFNDISIMRFNQYSVPSAGSTDSEMYNCNEAGEQLLKIDPSCIKKDDF